MNRVEACIILTSLDGFITLMAYKLSFDCTNNIYEYEALILGLKEKITMEIKYIHIYGDS